MIVYGDLGPCVPKRDSRLTVRQAPLKRSRLAAILETDPKAIIRANLEIQAIEQVAEERTEWPDTSGVELRIARAKGR